MIVFSWGELWTVDLWYNEQAYIHSSEGGGVGGKFTLTIPKFTTEMGKVRNDIPWAGTLSIVIPCYFHILHPPDSRGTRFGVFCMKSLGARAPEWEIVFNPWGMSSLHKVHLLGNFFTDFDWEKFSVTRTFQWKKQFLNWMNRLRFISFDVSGPVHLDTS